MKNLFSVIFLFAAFSSAHAQTGPKPPSRPQAANVISMYHSLPIEFLPGVAEWQKKSNLPDGQDTRKSLIEESDLTKGYLKAKAPAENLQTKVLMFKDNKETPYLAVQTMKCLGDCDSKLKVYRKDSTWTDITNQVLPVLDEKMILKTVKAGYKKTFGDEYKYEKRNYTDAAVFEKAMLMDIQPDGTILVKDQYLPLPLFKLQWNNRGGFDDKAL